MSKNKVLGGLFGVCVGDALGLPVEFVSRKALEKNPVTGMTGGGTFNMPPGTWSDDSSLTFCLAESLCNRFDLKNIADKFWKWYNNGYWTPFGKAFDVGNTTAAGILRLATHSPEYSGLTDESSNGNGSLMRTLPLAFYLKEKNDFFETVHQVSAITHAHPISLISCGVYTQVAINLLKGKNIREAYESMKGPMLRYYSERYPEFISKFNRVLNKDIGAFQKDEIHSAGFAIDTLESSLWCCLNHQTYKDTVLAAVNLGADSDTTAAVAGGLAGIHYGFENIPTEWVDNIARKKDIIDLAERLAKSLG
ncbi:MAG: ADP-ribosylglycohydrolase family protein [Phycisphaerae bacterium]|jgi:ADP-ribosylglycohydrolase